MRKALYTHSLLVSARLGCGSNRRGPEPLVPWRQEGHHVRHELDHYANGIIPGASITVYLTNTTTKATIQTVTGGVLANPFFSNAATAVDPGGFVFRAATNVGYDVVASGGGGNAACTVQPNCYATPVTLLTGVYASSSVAPVVNPLNVQTNGAGNASQTVLNFKDTATVKFTNPSGGVESATVPDGSNSAHGRS